MVIGNVNYGPGAGFYQSDGKTTVMDSYFNNLQAMDGAGLILDNNKFSLVKGNTFDSIQSDRYGGAIYVYNGGSENIEISENIFNNIEAQYGGAILFMHSCRMLDITGNNFYNTVAEQGWPTSRDTI